MWIAIPRRVQFILSVWFLRRIVAFESSPSVVRLQPVLKFINNSWRENKGSQYSELWRSFGYVIPIIIKVGELLLWISLRIINALRSYIKHSKESFIRYPNTSKLVNKRNSAASRFFNPLLSVWITDETPFLVFD